MRLPRPERSDLVAPLALGALLAALFFEVLFRGHVFYERDIHSLVLGQAETFVRCLAAGSWPVWDPYIGFGQPLLANPGAQVLYPWTWLNLLMVPGTWYTVYVLGHAWLAGLGMTLLARRWGLSRVGALLAAALWITSGPFLAFISLWQHFAGAAWIAWVLLAGDLAFDRPSRNRSLLLGLALGGQVLAGSAELCAATVVLLVVSALFRLDRRDPAGPANRRRLGSLLAAFAFGALFSAGQWLPAADVLRGSLRLGLGESVRSYWSLHPLCLLQVLFPVFPQDLPLLPGPRALLYDGREPFLSSIYLGIASAPLVLVALAGRPRRLAYALLALVLGGAFLALGRFGVIHGWLVSLVPPLGIFRYPAKAMIVSAFGWALLAGVGWDACRARIGRGEPLPRRLGLAAALLAALAAAGCWLLFFRPEMIAGTFLNAEENAGSRLAAIAAKLLSAGLLALCMAALAAWSRLRPTRWAAPALFALAMLDPFLAHRDLAPTLPAALLSKPPPTLGALAGGGLVRLYNFDYSVTILGKSYLRPTQGMGRPLPREGLSRAAAEALAFQAYLSWGINSRWALQGSYVDDLGLLPQPVRNLTLLARASEDTPGLHRLLRIGAVTHVIALHEEGLQDLVPVASLPGVYTRPIRVFRVPDPLPRTLVVGASRVVTGRAGYDALLDPGFDPAREALVADGPPLTGEGPFEGESRLVEYRPDRVVVEARASRSALVLLVDGWHPGWRARVDGRETPVVRANVGFRAVEIGAGRHRVELFYRPAAVVVGLATTVVAIGVALGFLLAGLRRRRT